MEPARNPDCDPVETPVLVVGAGPSGLAVSACLHERGIAYRVLDGAHDIGASWRAHYNRLHLHTVKSHSALPGLAFPADAPRYVSRRAFVDYLVAYARHHRIEPELGQEVQAIEPLAPSARAAKLHWSTLTASGRRYLSRHVVVATGANRRARIPGLPGRAAFTGRVLHSADYREPAPFAGQRVLVVGMGNTGAEIALDLAEHGVAVGLSVRAPVNIVYRDMLGRPTQLSGIALGKLPTPIGDRLASLLRDLTVGDLSRWGIRTPASSPLRQLREEGRTPVIDVGTVARIKAGDIKVHPGIAVLRPDGVTFVDGTEAGYDTILLATGYSPALERLFPAVELALDARGLPIRTEGEGALAGVHFVGFDIRQPGGLLRTIAAEAQAVCGRIGRDRADTGSEGCSRPARPKSAAAMPGT